ncbi:MAG: universal stress protein [Acidimicrobiales bacterium]
MQRFVVGVDESAAAAAALRWAGGLAATAGAEIVAVNAFPNPWAEMRPEDQERLIDDRQQLLAGEWTRPATDAAASVRTTLRQGDPRDVLLTVAEAEEADLVVLGRTGGGGGPGFLHLGSVVEHAAHHLGRPLAVIPSTASGPIERIILGVDGSADSLVAVNWCAELARVTEATVVAVSVWEPYIEWTPSSSAANWRRDLELRIAEWVTPISEAGVTVEYVAQRDLHPCDGLLGVASARAGDVLVLGARGAGGFLGLRVGGVAMKVLHRASMPVVLVPPRG